MVAFKCAQRCSAQEALRAGPRRHTALEAPLPLPAIESSLYTPVTESSPERQISWRQLVPNIVHDQKQICSSLFQWLTDIIFCQSSRWRAPLPGSWPPTSTTRSISEVRKFLPDSIKFSAVPIPRWVWRSSRLRFTPLASHEKIRTRSTPCCCGRGGWTLKFLRV